MTRREQRQLVAMQQFSAELFATAEAAEGMAAFRERRAPAWAAEGVAEALRSVAHPI